MDERRKRTFKVTVPIRGVAEVTTQALSPSLAKREALKIVRSFTDSLSALADDPPGGAIDVEIDEWKLAVPNGRDIEIGTPDKPCGGRLRWTKNHVRRWSFECEKCGARGTREDHSKMICDRPVVPRGPRVSVKEAP